MNSSKKNKPSQEKAANKHHAANKVKNQNKNHKHIMAFNDQPIKADNEQLICLTDLWKAAKKSNANNAPAQWLRLPESKEFIAALGNEIVGKSHNLVKSKGRLGTYAHWQIALAYAKYLSPELHMHVNEVYMRYRSGDVTLADEIADKASPEHQEWLAKRVFGKVKRNKFTQTLQDHGIRKGWEFAKCTNAIYIPLLGGTAKEIKQMRHLPEKANLRDDMSIDEIVAVSFAEIVSTKRIQREKAKGFLPCADISKRSAQEVAMLLE